MAQVRMENFFLRAEALERFKRIPIKIPEISNRKRAGGIFWGKFLKKNEI